MTWDAAASVGRFDDAVDWFLARTVLTGDEGRGIEADGQSRSFWVGMGLQLDQVQRVFDSLDEAQSKGLPFDEWRKGIRETLRSPDHAETVFRNANQRAYNAGRWAQMSDPDVIEFRPYWMYDAILDGRTTKLICRPRDETVLLASDPWWHSNWPPLHHNCRSSVRSLTQEQAEARGIATASPEVDENPGWGRSPVNDEPWAPPPGRYDPQLKAEANRKVAARRPRAQLPERHDPQHWESTYSDFGAAAPAMAHGKASLEIGLDMTLETARAALAPVAGLPGPAQLLAAAEALPPTSTLRELGGEHTPLLRGLAALAGHIDGIDPREPWERRFRHPEALQGVQWFNAVAGKGVQLPGTEYRFTKRTGRAQHVAHSRIDYHDLGSFAHEVGHAIELLNGPKSALAFLAARTRGEQAQHLSTLLGDSRFYPEKAKPDGFLNAYIGKIYSHEATEITSMALETLAGGTRDWGDLAEWLVDSEHLVFTLGQLAGK